MSKFEFRPAKRENVPLLIGLAGGTGSGKTYSALLLARGLAGGKPFAVIDTENRRALHYADEFKFQHGDLAAPFTPQAYAEAIAAADAAHYPVIVVDSASHEHAGDGGLLDMHDSELQRMAGNDWDKRDKCNMAAWIKPKMEHKRMVSRLLQIRAHLILCFRAEEKIEMVKEGGKLVVKPKQSLTGLHGWLPICEKNLPFEMTASFLLMADHPGVPLPIKLEKQHKPFFPAGKPITEAAGEALAVWARGGAAQPPAAAENAGEAGEWTGTICDVVDEEMGGKPVFVVRGEKGAEFRTVDKAMAERARKMEGAPASIAYKVTDKGGKLITSLRSAA